jgi:hypothetical protein
MVKESYRAGGEKDKAVSKRKKSGVGEEKEWRGRERQFCWIKNELIGVEKVGTRKL